MQDLTGCKFGRLEVVEFAYGGETPSGTKKYFWLCKCDCGNTVTVERSHLTTGHTSSCGCLHAETKNTLTHGLSRTRVYRVWRRMKERCTNRNCSDYANYGGRGIKISDEWMKFEPFYSWATENGYRDDLTIDRIDNNGPYSPVNCRWITQKEQCNNKRTCVYVEFKGDRKTVKEWSEIYEIKYSTLVSRIKAGWPIEKALTEKIHRRK